MYLADCHPEPNSQGLHSMFASFFAKSPAAANVVSDKSEDRPPPRNDENAGSVWAGLIGMCASFETRPKGRSSG
jgi:hypothetical protein